jgi:hypothetical protein
VPEAAAKRKPRAARLIGVAVTREEAIVRRNPPLQLSFVGVQEQLLEPTGLVRFELLGPVRPLLFECFRTGRLWECGRWKEEGCGQQQAGPSYAHATDTLLRQWRI